MVKMALRRRLSKQLLCALSVALASVCVPAGAAAAVKPNLPSGVSIIASTVPANGDINPYGLVVVPATVGNLTEGHLLVSNFNNSQNLQGTGTTIMDISPDGTANVFAQFANNSLPGPCPGGIGLTTALAVLQTGWVIVGSLPTVNGMSATAQAGCLVVINSSGKPVGTFYGSLINGPWDMTALDQGSQATLFFTNVLNGTVAANGNVVHGGTVVRMVLSIAANSKPAIESMTVIGSGFSERTDPAALVIGPTGVGLSGTTLYVADSLNNRVTAIANATTITSTAGTGTVFSRGGFLNDPLGLTIDPSTGNVLVTNGNNGALVTIDPSGTQTRNALDNTGSPPGAGTLFGLVSVPGVGVYFVDDGSNTLNLFQQPAD
jgi:hypothetical protein